MPIKKSEFTDADGAAEFVSTDESFEIDEWTSASEHEGAWTIP
jgi:hypothetical protein